MSIIIRLQNLPWSANALDIRQFFSGLSIPEGGVHIVGGELGDAFIAFSTDEDARQAFNRNGGKIKEVQIKLMLSSRTEMQKVIEAARSPLTAFMQSVPVAPPAPQLLPTPVPANVPELKSDESKGEKRDRRRSRSRSRDRKERSRERDRRDRRRRDRSRSRSRDYRDRRRRDRSHSREKRSKERDRRSKDRRRSEESSPSNGGTSKPMVWEDPVRSEINHPNANVVAGGGIFPNIIEEARRNLNPFPNPSLISNRNGFPDNFNQREGWQQGDNGFSRQDMRGNFPGNNTENQRNFMQNSNFNDRMGGFNSRGVTDNRFGQTGKTPLLDRPPFPLDTPKGNCVLVRPFYGGYGEIRRLFQGIFINNKGIKFLNDDFGNPTGIVYVRCALPDGKSEALQRHGSMLRHQVIEILHLDDDVFENAVDRFHPDQNDKEEGANNFRFSPTRSGTPQESTLMVENLPSYTKEHDLFKMFADYSISSIFITSKNRRLIAYVKFSNVEDAKQAHSEKIKYCMDGKPLTLRLCTNEDLQNVGDNFEEGSGASKDAGKHVPSDCVALTGLPSKTTDRDITDFFSDVAIVPQKVHLLTTNTGFSGDAFCEFATIQDAQNALEKDGIPLGSGTVSVKSVPRSEMETTIGIPPSRKIMHPTHMGHNSNPNSRPFFPRPYFPPRGHGMMSHHRPPMKRYPQQQQQQQLMGPNLHNSGEVGVPGCTVLMENVPYKAGLEEILEFFDGYDIPPDNVLRRYNENGTPSGEAKVIFASSKDAIQAIKEKQHLQIRDRTIYLSMC